tara:strand:- start:2286 stop:3452 length:1167 start_codon:yes stop_codon:yes gene_type:complete
MKKYFIYNNNYISGWRYWLRILLQSFLIYIFGLGIYLQGVTAYTRAKSLGHSDGVCWTFGILIPIFIILALLASVYPDPSSNILLLILNIPHWYLWFKDGPGKNNLEINPNKNTISKKIKDDKSKLSSNLKKKTVDSQLIESVIPKEIKNKITNSKKATIIEISKDEMDNLSEVRNHDDEYEGKNPTVAKSKIYYDKDNKPFTGILMSKKTEDDGVIECEYLEGYRNGEYIQYDNEDENKISLTKFYKNGVLHGPFTHWYEKYKDGKKPKEDKEIPKFDNPELDAMFGSILKKHDIMLQINYKDGLLHGKWMQFNFNGGIEYEISYKNGKKDGVWRGYFSGGIFGGQGRLKQVSVYKENKLISSKYYDFEGEEVDLNDVDDEWGEQMF